MKAFLSGSFDEEDKPIINWFKKLLRILNIDPVLVTGLHFECRDYAVVLLDNIAGYCFAEKIRYRDFRLNKSYRSFLNRNYQIMESPSHHNFFKKQCYMLL